MGAFSELKGMMQTIGKAGKLKPLPLDTRLSLGKMVEQTAADKPNSLMLIFEGETLTWAEFNKLANQFAHYLQELGIERGQTVAILMENRIENLLAITAVCKLGAVASMINTNLTDTPLIHCIESVASTAIIFGSERSEAVEGVKRQLTLEHFIACKDTRECQIPSWAEEFDRHNNDYPSNNLKVTGTIKLRDVAYYIFTSGTTGLPKASIITHDRHTRMAKAFAEIAIDMQASDRIYICLPLYHSSAMFIGFGAITHTGASMFLRRKFSASKLLDEAREYNTNCFAYIGELCRYLMLQPQKPDDANNPITKIVGNGLRPDIWLEFKKRFAIEKVGEFYGASEGNAGCVNAFNKDLTVGFCSTKHAILQYDLVNDEIIRDKRGNCLKVEKGQAGLFAIAISEKAKFDGYANKEASKKKVIRNVFKQGDAYFDTGDLLKQVDVGFSLGIPHYQFVDRVGDTFRWKGENVSTNEVGEIINQSEELEFCNVYGVQIPNTDGRGGMAAIVAARDAIDMASLSKHINNKLPHYAQPLFLRLIDDIDTTGTFKMLKGELRDEAFHPNKAGNAIYVKKPGKQNYEPLDQAFYELIQSGEAGF